VSPWLSLRIAGWLFIRATDIPQLLLILLADLSGLAVLHLVANDFNSWRARSWLRLTQPPAEES
jgi:hypothetical protein